MKAMVLESVGTPLKLIDRPDPIPRMGEIRLKVEACAVCRTDLHVVDGDLLHPKLPLVPGHEIVGIIDSVGKGVARSRIGRRVGVPWLGHTCGHCPYCVAGSENLCDQPDFTGYTRDGGFASHVVADAHFAFDLDSDDDPVSLAPLLCAGLIGWRCLKKAGDGKRLGIYGFGAAARLVPIALGAVRKGGRVVCGGIHMSDIPAIPYELLWEERELVSVANLTRRDAEEFFPVAKSAKVRTYTKAYPLEQANQALDDLRRGRLSGAAVLVP